MHKYLSFIFRYFFLLIYLLVGFSTFSQVPNLKFKHITTEQGLSNSTIEAIYQDSRGFMWFGTRDGLNRYDGNSMVIFKHDLKNATSISDNYITCIYEDAKKNLWIGTINGLNKFDQATNTFTNYKSNQKDVKSLSNNHITSLMIDKKGRLWIATKGGGINLLESSEGKFSSFQQKKGSNASLNNNYVNYIFEDSRGNCWVGTQSGLQLFNRENRTFKSIDVLKNLDEKPKNYLIYCINEDKQGNLLLGTTDNGFIIFNYQFNTTKLFSHKETQITSLASNLVRSILVDKNKNIWVGCINGGLNLFDPVSDRFYNYQYRPDEPKSLSQRTISAIFEDNQGNFWVGTHRGGINLYMPNTEKFTLFRQESYPNSLSYNDVKAFCEDRNGNIWIGTDGGGLNLFNRKTKSFKHYKHNPFNQKTIGSNEVVDITEDSQGNIWVATWGGGLCLYNKNSDNFTRFLHNAADSKSVSSNYIQQIFEDRKHHLWIGTYYGGLNLFDPKTKTFSRVVYGQNKTQLLGNNILSLNEDKAGNIWIGTDDGGLNCYEESTKTFRHYFNNDKKRPDFQIIFNDSKNRIWLGQTGLYLFNPKQKTFSVFTDKLGLSTEFIKAIEEDSQGNLWLSTSNGIMQLNPETLSAKKYNTSDGLQGLEFETNAFLKTQEGEIFFGGINGFNTFYPQNISQNTFIPPVYVTDFQVDNQKVIVGKDSPLQTDISLTKEITLTHQQTTFSFSFAALNYTASENNRYAYRLKDWDKDWIYPQNEKKASYTNVSPGEYTFQVRASNNDGVWNKKEYAIRVMIKPPFWATWWFRIFILLAIGTGIVQYYRFKRALERRHLEEQKKEEIHQEQLQFFTNISHEFRTPLSLILGPLERLKKENTNESANHYYELMYRNANRLLSLINELMDFRKSESGVLKLNVMQGNLDSFVAEISDEFSELAVEKDIKFNISLKNKIHATWFDRQILEKIVINLLSNSFKYIGNGNHIEVEILDTLEKFKPSFENELIIPNEFRGTDYIYIRVADNGIGISKESIAHLFERYYKISEAHLGSGIGLAFVKSLTSLHKGNIYVYSERNKGTEIIIEIPCKKEDYTQKERWVTNKEVTVRLESIQIKDEYNSPIREEKRVKISVKPIVKNKLSILIVDDNDELRKFLKDSLSITYQISEANDGQEGYEKVKEEFPDLIISDVMMPLMDGIEFCKMVKQNDETSHIPFLLLTAKNAEESKIEGIESGADFYFSKPLSIELLTLTIRNIFTQKQRAKEKYFTEQHSDVIDLAHSVSDKKFLTDLIDLVESHLSNPEMNIDYICSQIGMSRTKLYNKIKSLTGQSIGDFIRTIRLKKAVQLMTHENMSIAEVMYNVGIQTQSYFSKAFKTEFGKTPMQFLKDLKSFQ